jgi:uncharacterized membrane protein
MSNTIGGINLTVIAQDGLTTLLSEFPLINTFTTNFGGDIAQKGEAVTTRIASSVSATDIGANGYAASNVTSTAKTVTLNQHKGFVMGFDDGEVAKGGYDMLKRTFLAPAAHATVKAIMDDVFALVTAGNFASVGYNSTVAAFDADSVASLSQVLTDANNPQAGRTLLVKPSLYTSLAKDNAIQAQYASGTNAPVTENLLPRIHGFTVRQYSDLPATVANQKGIACTPEAILIATRLPATPSNWYGNVATATDKLSGLSIQVREWYDGKDGKQYISMSLLYGVAVGNANCLTRIIAT